MRSSTPTPWRAALGGLLALTASAAGRGAGGDGLPEAVRRLADDWRWARFTTEDGLPADGVRHLVEGAVPWVGTERGVAWFDGWIWHAVGVDDGLPAERVLALARAGDGSIIVALRGGLFRGSRAGFAPVALPAPWSAEGVDSLAGLADGSVLVACSRTDTGELGVLRMAGETVREVPLPAETVQGPAPAVRATEDGRAWVNLVDGLYRRSGPAWERVVAAEFAMLSPNEVLVDPDGRGWIAVQAPPPDVGLLRLEADGGVRRAAESPGLVQAAGWLAERTALAVLDSGSARWNAGDGWRELPAVPEPLELARFVRRRADGDLWIGTDRGLFLFRASLERWSALPRRADAPPLSRRVHELALDGRGRLWMATAGGLEAVDADGTPLRLPPLPDGDVQLTGLAVARDGAVWACGGGVLEGLRRWDGERWTTHLVDAEGAPLGFVHKLRRDRAGRLWVLGLSRDVEAPSAQAGGVHVIDGGAIERWAPEAELPGRRVYDLAEGPDGALWLATSRGLARWRDGAMRVWRRIEGAERLPVGAVQPDADGGAWFAPSTGGLGRIEPDGALRILPVAGAPHAHTVFDLALDADGDLWVTSSRGLHRLRGGRWVDFGEVTGLPHARLWPILVTPERLLVGSLGRGAFALDLAHLEPMPARVMIAQPFVDGDRIHVDWYPHTWMGELSRAEIPTRYRLDGGAWSAWSTRTETDLYGLPPGEHAFEIEALGPLGALGYGRTTVTVPPPLHRRAAFAVPIAILLGALLALSALHCRRRRRDARSLLRSEREHRRLLEEASDGIVLFDADGHCVHANSRASDLCGRPREELLGRATTELFGPGWADPPADGTPRLVERRFVDARGASVVVEAGAKRLEDGRLQVIARDITARLREEHERIAIERRLAESQKLEGLALLAGGVAHDFNNLLTVILGSAEEARRLLDPGSHAREELLRIVAAAESAGELTQQLLAYAGRGSIRRESVDVGALVRETTHLLRSSLNRDVRLELELAPGLPPVDADTGRLRQVLINLVVNAGEAIGRGPGAIRVRTAPSGSPEQPAVLIEVADDGKGMSPADQARIFDPFYTTKDGGRGLGLAAVRGILHTHDGSIEVDSAPGQGTTFRLHLPAGRLQPSEEPVPAPLPARRDGRILLVDDDAHVRRVTVNLLTGAGYEVVAVPDGRGAREAFETDPTGFAAAVLDQVMPCGSGTDALEELRRSRPDLPALIVSGYSSEDVSAYCAELPRTAYLQKPYQARSLLARLDEVLADPLPAGASAAQR